MLAVVSPQPKPAIDTVMTLVTPEMATAMLARNIANRRVRPGKVRTFVALLRSGRFECHHQGVAVDELGNVIDGQHRLIAIRDSGVAAWLNVSTNVPRRTFAVIDTHTTRSIEDATGVDGKVAAVATCLLRLALGSHPPRHMAVDATQALQSEHAELDAACSTVRRGLSSAPVRSAAIATAIVSGDSTYPLLMYRALVCRQFDEMPPVMQSFYKQMTDSERNLKRGYDETAMWFARAVIALDQRNAQFTKIQIKDIDRFRNFAAAALKKKGISIADGRVSA